MGGNTPKGIYKHNISYFSAPVNKYSLFSLDLQIQTLDLVSLDLQIQTLDWFSLNLQIQMLDLVMILNSYAGGRCPSGILTLYYMH